MKNSWAIFICCLMSKNLFVMSFKQPYTVTQVDVIGSPGNLLTSSLRLVGRDQALNGTVMFLKDLYDDVVLQLDLFSDTLRNGEFKPMAIKLPAMGICSSLKTYYERFIKASLVTNVHTNFDFQDGIVCPFPKGEYWLKNITMESRDWISILPTGFIKAQLSLIKNTKFAGGVAVIVDIQQALFPI